MNYSNCPQLEAKGPWKVLESFSPDHALLKVAHKKGTVSYWNKKKKEPLRGLLAEKNQLYFVWLVGFQMHVNFYKNWEWKAMVIDHSSNKPQNSSCKREGRFLPSLNVVIHH